MTHFLFLITVLVKALSSTCLHFCIIYFLYNTRYKWGFISFIHCRCLYTILNFCLTQPICRIWFPCEAGKSNLTCFRNFAFVCPVIARKSLLNSFGRLIATRILLRTCIPIRALVVVDEGSGSRGITNCEIYTLVLLLEPFPSLRAEN